MHVRTQLLVHDEPGRLRSLRAGRYLNFEEREWRHASHGSPRARYQLGLPLADRCPVLASLPPRVAALRRSSREIVDGATGEVRADGEAVGPVCPTWKGRNKPHRADRRWVQGWSPQQISERLKLDFVDDESMRISHDAIYQALMCTRRCASNQHSCGVMLPPVLYNYDG